MVLNPKNPTMPQNPLNNFEHFLLFLNIVENNKQLFLMKIQAIDYPE
jgi:hypothetical protein